MSAAKKSEATVSINGSTPIPMDKFESIVAELVRPRYILDTITQLLREAIADKIEQVENAAAEAAEDSDDDKPVIAKLGVSIKWPAGAPVPEITIKASYSITRSTELSGLADGDQGKLPLDGGAE